MNIGVFPPFVPTSPAQPSFFQATLPKIRSRLLHDNGDYSAFWTRLLSSLPSSMTLRSILTSLLTHLTPIHILLDDSVRSCRLVTREALLVKRLVGPLHKDNSELVDCFSAVAFGRNWNEGHARIFACWAAGAQKDSKDREGAFRWICLLVTASSYHPNQLSTFSSRRW